MPRHTEVSYGSLMNDHHAEHEINIGYCRDVSEAGSDEEDSSYFPRTLPRHPGHVRVAETVREMVSEVSTGIAGFVPGQFRRRAGDCLDQDGCVDLDDGRPLQKIAMATGALAFGCLVMVGLLSNNTPAPQAGFDAQSLQEGDVFQAPSVSQFLATPPSTVKQNTRNAQIARYLAKANAQATVPKEDNFALVFDFGSSGSRVHVYRWKVTDPLRSIVELGNKKVSPGINFYAETSDDLKAIPARAGASILPLLTFATQLVPPEQREQTFIIAGATAGVRHLPTLAKKEAVIAGARAVMDQSPFRVMSCAVMPGWQEATFDFLSVNAALGMLAVPGMPTSGSVDLGGASSQIAYATAATWRDEKEPIRDNSRITAGKPGRFKIELASGVNVEIYAVSRAHYGSREAFKYVVTADVDGEFAGIRGWLYSPKTRPDANEVYTHPCIPPGVYATTYRGSKVRGSGDAALCLETVSNYYKEAAAIDLGNVTSTFPMPKPYTAGGTVPFLAFDHILQAEKIADAVLETAAKAKAAEEPKEPGWMEKIPPQYRKFITGQMALERAGRTGAAAASTTAAPAGNFNEQELEDCVHSNPRPDKRKLWEASQLLCPLPWGEASLRYGGVIKSPHEGCFLLSYVMVLIEQVYELNELHAAGKLKRCAKFAPSDLARQYPATFKKAMESGEKDALLSLESSFDASWALGAMVFHLESPQKGGKVQAGNI